MLKNLSYDSIAELYVTKFSTISLYLTKLYTTYSRAFHHRHQSHAAKSAKTFITVFRWFWCGSDMVPYCSDMAPPWFSNDANPLIWLDPTFVKETKWCFRSSLLRARALSLGWEHAVHIRAARLHGGLLSHRQATIHLHVAFGLFVNHYYFFFVAAEMFYSIQCSSLRDAVIFYSYISVIFHYKQ